MYSPLARNGAGPGKKVGIIGLGGLVRLIGVCCEKYVKFCTQGSLWSSLCEGPGSGSVCFFA